MRKIIYLAIIERLKAARLGIAHFNLWNNHIAYLEKERGYRFPALFVEFEPIEWHQQMNRIRTADLRVRLHIVTKTLATPEDKGKYQNKALEYLDLIEKINAAMQGLCGEGFNAFMLVGSEPDHDHAEILHNVEIFVTHVTDVSARPAQAMLIAPHK